MNYSIAVFSSFILSALCVFLIGYTLHRVRRVHKRTFEIENQIRKLGSNGLQDEFRQIQALLSLEKELGLGLNLPSLRGWAASPDFLLVLVRLIRSRKPETILECGSGATTIAMARCAQQLGRGHIYSLDHDPTYAERTRKFLADAGLEKWATIIDAPLMDHSAGEEVLEWYSLKELPDSDFDILVVDGPPTRADKLARYPAIPLLFKQLSANSLIVLDDASRPEEIRIAQMWEDEFPFTRLIAHDCEKGCVVFRKDSK